MDVREQVSHPHNVPGKIKILYTLTLYFWTANEKTMDRKTADIT